MGNRLSQQLLLRSHSDENESQRRLDRVRSLLEIIGEGELAKGEVDPSLKYESDEELLRKAIAEHIEIIRLIREFDKLLTDIFLVQVLQTTIVSTMCFFSASKISSLRDIPKFFTIITATYLQFYIYCWLGSEISEHSNGLHRGLYQSKWYKSNLKVKRIVTVFESFSKHHFKLKGGRIFTIHLETFLKMLKESFSYFMVLRAISK